MHVKPIKWLSLCTTTARTCYTGTNKFMSTILPVQSSSSGAPIPPPPISMVRLKPTAHPCLTSSPLPSGLMHSQTLLHGALPTQPTLPRSLLPPSPREQDGIKPSTGPSGGSTRPTWPHSVKRLPIQWQTCLPTTTSPDSSHRLARLSPRLWLVCANCTG